MNDCQQDVLIDSSVSRNELSFFIFWQEIVFADFKLSIFKFSETVGSFLVSTINVTGIKPRWDCVDMGSDSFFDLVDWTGEAQLLFSSAEFIEDVVTSWNWDVEVFVGLGGSQGDIVTDKLTPWDEHMV